MPKPELRKRDLLRSGWREILKASFWFCALPQHPIIGFKLILCVLAFFLIDILDLLRGRHPDFR